MIIQTKPAMADARQILCGAISLPFLIQLKKYIHFELWFRHNYNNKGGVNFQSLLKMVAVATEKLILCITVHEITISDHEHACVQVRTLFTAQHVITSRHMNLIRCRTVSTSTTLSISFCHKYAPEAGEDE
jgi:hypothetical protein